MKVIYESKLVEKDGHFVNGLKQGLEKAASKNNAPVSKAIKGTIDTVNKLNPANKVNPDDIKSWVNKPYIWEIAFKYPDRIDTSYNNLNNYRDKAYFIKQYLNNYPKYISLNRAKSFGDWLFDSLSNNGYTVNKFISNIEDCSGTGLSNKMNSYFNNEGISKLINDDFVNRYTPPEEVSINADEDVGKNTSEATEEPQEQPNNQSDTSETGLALQNAYHNLSKKIVSANDKNKSVAILRNFVNGDAQWLDFNYGIKPEQREEILAYIASDIIGEQ